MNDLPDELPPNPFDDATPRAPDVAGTQADFLSNVSPPDQGNQIPAGGPGPDYQTSQDTEDTSHEHLKGTYMHDPQFVDTPQGVGNFLTTMTTFGGAKDYAEEKRHPGKGDLGGLAGGGRTYDPKTGMESNIPVVALPDAFKKFMPYGTQFDLYNPKDPSRRVTVAYGDRGPASYTGVGLDAYLPKWANEALNVKSGEQVGMDMTGVIAGTAQQLSQPPQPGTSYDQQIGNAIRERMTSQPQSLMAGDVTADAISRAMQNSSPTLNKDGSVNYGGGVSIYPETGIIQYEPTQGGPIYQKLPNQDKFQRMVPHLPPQPPELIKETREASLPMFHDDGKPLSGLEMQKQLDDYYQKTGLASPAIRKEATAIRDKVQSSRNPWIKQFLAIGPNYDTIQSIASDTHRTGADDVAMLQAIANIEAPGRSSTGHDMHQWAAANGMAGQLGVTKARYGALYDFLTGKMTQDDWEKGGQTLPAELIPQLKRVADRAMEARYKQFIQGVTPDVKRLKRLGISDVTEYIPQIENPVTGLSPFDEQGNIHDTFKPQTKVVQEAQPGTTPTLDPSTAAETAQRVLSDPNSSQSDRVIAQKVILSLKNSQ